MDAQMKIDEGYVGRIVRDAEEALDEISSAIRAGKEDFISSRTLRFSVRYSVIQLVEALADLGLAILERGFGEGAEGYRDVFKRLALRGVVSPEAAEGMMRLASLRNMIVHRYWDVDDSKIFDEAEGVGIAAVRRFITEVVSYVSQDC